MSSTLDRRTFLKTAAIGTGGLVTGCTHLKAVKAPLRVAVIGCGGRGQSAHISAACDERLVAVVDADENNIAKALKRAGIIKSDEVRVKILGNGTLDRAVTVVADAFSEKARQVIEAAGGRAEVRKP